MERFKELWFGVASVAIGCATVGVFIIMAIKGAGYKPKLVVTYDLAFIPKVFIL